MRVSSTVIVLSLLAGILWQGGSCQPSIMNSQPNQETDKVPTGTWGGDHIGLEVTDQMAEIEFDCAHGTINHQLTLDSDLNFNLTGTYTREHAGPVRREEGSHGQPARFTGHVDGQTMTLTITLIEKNETLGTFTLTHGRQPRIMKCR